MSENSNIPASEKIEPPKKPYHTPQLSLYGSVREITKAMGGTTGKNDGGGGPDKTSP